MNATRSKPTGSGSRLPCRCEGRRSRTQPVDLADHLGLHIAYHQGTVAFSMTLRPSLS